MTAKGRRLFCFGYGYSARALGQRLKAEGWALAGTTRSEERADALRAEGVEAYVFDRDQPLADPAAALDGATHVLLSVPPGAEGDPVYRSHKADLAALSSLEWLGYLSTTGVYGDRAGGWVDEDSALEPTGPRGERRVTAERAWRDFAEAQGIPLMIFRLAGIYGPGRSTFDAIRAGRAKRIDKPGQVFSRIHVDDIASVLEAALARPRASGIYNLCDDDPEDPAEVVAFAYRLLDQEPPPLVPFESAELSDMGRSFYRDSKRVKNDRIKSELGVTLAYPSYKVGLPKILAQQSGAD